MTDAQKRQENKKKLTEMTVDIWNRREYLKLTNWVKYNI